ncbi:unnamed protein product [Phyllotreta striolata]|uniref:DNA repair and recombination protein RAD54-like n=1 Tax=Phyllotreta striolata TaxID=444603 RepID=A0A9P0GRC2_PHYSR|nr:unnamed protein product [Phyllotreta striolata]
MSNKNSELESLSLAGNINIWSENQSTLEEQALKELQTFAKELNTAEDGEITDDNEKVDEKEDKNFSLNVESYIKQQQDLKKRQDFQRSLANDTIKSNNNSKKRKVRDDSDLEDKSGSEYVPSDDEDSDPSYNYVDEQTVITKKNKRKECTLIEKTIDDGDCKSYKARLDLYYKLLEQEEESSEDDSKDVHTVQDNLKIPYKIWNKLYRYQQEGVKWMWNIHRKSTGGLLGDEMGLGKTVQVIVFLHSLHHSQISSCHGRFVGLGPTLIVCPATVIHQWVKHFHEWAPEFRAAVLHQSGSYKGDKNRLIKDVRKTKGVIITTYQGVIKYEKYLTEHEWHYVILDEGHKIRNPATKATQVVKSLNTPHRLMLTGSPMQNDLTELWSLFDFTNPGMLGDLKTFQEHFIEPILQGGYSNSTYAQEATALSVAGALKDLIDPYLLRRTKHQVQRHVSLPNKTEQVLFCSLSDEQKALYKDYLLSDPVADILGKGVKNWSGDHGVRAKVFVAITKLRKICNHPDIYLSDGADEESLRFDYKSSGKMVVVSALLKIWKKQGHRVLLFTQGRSMMEVLRRFLDRQGYKYLKMDGTTAIGARQPLIEKFNTDSSYDVFLLTTRVGGLGVNLTGANRVIIYDPDWNPATDTQARERAWRIGQDKDVTIYRLLTAGTIEEKMYQRQVWKQLLSNKILLDPRTNKFFKSSDLFDLFSLQENADNAPETVNIFHKSRVRIQEKLKRKSKPKRPEASPKRRFTDEKLLEMKHMAHRIAKSLSKPPPESADRLELEREKRRRREETDEAKRLEVAELRRYNREKAGIVEDVHANKIDDRDALVGFSEALEYAETTARLHHELKTNNKDLDEIADEVNTAKETVSKEPEKLIKKFKKRKIDLTGKIDGEKIEGLVKTETKKTKNAEKDKNNASNKSGGEDDFILGKLFNKKGVSGAIQHDSVVQETSKGGSLRVHTEAQMRAEKSLQALKKSRLDNWKW